MRQFCGPAARLVTKHWRDGLKCGGILFVCLGAVHGLERTAEWFVVVFGRRDVERCSLRGSGHRAGRVALGRPVGVDVRLLSQLQSGGAGTASRQRRRGTRRRPRAGVRRRHQRRNRTVPEFRLHAPRSRRHRDPPDVLVQLHLDRVRLIYLRQGGYVLIGVRSIVCARLFVC